MNSISFSTQSNNDDDMFSDESGSSTVTAVEESDLEDIDYFQQPDEEFRALLAATRAVQSDVTEPDVNQEQTVPSIPVSDPFEGILPRNVTTTQSLAVEQHPRSSYVTGSSYLRSPRSGRYKPYVISTRLNAHAKRVVSNDPEDMTVPDVDSNPSTSLQRFQPLNLQVPQLHIDRREYRPTDPSRELVSQD